jgi:hypothetical protein
MTTIEDLTDPVEILTELSKEVGRIAEILTELSKEVGRIADACGRIAKRIAARSYTLVNINGEASVLSWAGLTEFLDVNEFEGDERRGSLLRLAVGETYRGGGGASPEWTIRRVA